MCAMSPRLLRPVATGFHPEANAWRSAVIANGGSVSASTMRAVSKFCADIDAAGLRSLFYRLNLMCGTSDASLVAPRVPLYRGPSRTGTQYGDAIDTNVNFVQADYQETGAGGGLKGNGTNKYLNSTLAADFPKANGGDVHFGTYATVLPITAIFQRFIGLFDNASPATYYSLLARPDQSPALFAWYCGGNATAAQANMPAAGHYVGTDAVSKRVGVNGTASTPSQGAGTNTTNNTARPFFVFAENANGSPGSYNNGRFAGYHIGVSITDGQIGSLYTIMQAFQTALGRNV
jgi:hypothetical protein